MASRRSDALPDNRRIRALAKDLRAMEHLPVEDLRRWLRDRGEAAVPNPFNRRCRYPDCSGDCEGCYVAPERRA